MVTLAITTQQFCWACGIGAAILIPLGLYIITQALEQQGEGQRPEAEARFWAQALEAVRHDEAEGAE